MKKIYLTNQEVDTINLFMDDITTISMVEGVYMLPYYAKNSGQSGIYIVTVYNNSKDYNNMVSVDEAVCNSDEEYNKINENIKRLNTIYKDERISFSIQNAVDFSTKTINQREFLSRRLLASGTILFDRFGNITSDQEAARRLVGTINNVYEVDNIKSILPRREYYFQYSKRKSVSSFD